MVEVNFYDNVDDELLKFAVIIAKTNGKWVFCKHKERETYEVPGGHRPNLTSTLILASTPSLKISSSFRLPTMLP